MCIKIGVIKVDFTSRLFLAVPETHYLWVSQMGQTAKSDVMMGFMGWLPQKLDIKDTQVKNTLDTPECPVHISVINS